MADIRFRKAVRFVGNGLCVACILLALSAFTSGSGQLLSGEEAIQDLSPESREDADRLVQADMAELPIGFVANAGQADANVRCMVKAGTQTIFFAPQAVVFAVSEETEGDLTRGSAVRLRFAGANADVRLNGQEELLGVANFFWGNDPKEWRANVPTHETITYHNLYPGIDLIYSSKEGHLKSEFVVAPGADPTVIIMEYSGASGMYVRQDGALVLETPVGELVEAPPLIYQVIDEEHVAVQGVYCVLAEGVVGFALSEYDPKELLLIDPALVYSTYLGGAGKGHGDIAVDSDGNVYVTGGTTRPDFPTRNAYQSYQGKWDVFITKLDASGSLVYSTYLGGGESDEGYGIAVDSSGNVYVTGYTESSDFPTRNAYQSYYRGGNGDVFVAKLGPSGSLVYSTYLGGEEIDWGYKGSGFAGNGDRGYDIAVDTGGNVYVTGYTESSDFPTLNAYQSHYQEGHGDVFVAKLEPSGSSLVYSTFLGGEGADKGYGITVDSSGNAYVIGCTGSGEFPTLNAYQSHYQGYSDALVAKLDSSGSLIYSTYLGGKSQDEGHGIAVDNSGNAYVTGFTQSTDFPALNAYESFYNRYWAFVTKLDPSGSLIYTTYLGGLGNDEKDEGRGIAVDSSGYIYVTGNTASRDFPTQNAYQSYFQGYWDAFVTKLDPSGSSLVFSTYLGGEGEDIGESIAVDSSGNIYVAGNTTSREFPTRNAYQSHYQGYRDVFVAKLDPSGSPNQPPIADAGPDQIISEPHGETLEVGLDGSGSIDPDGEDMAFSWAEEGRKIAGGESPLVTLPVGEHRITLTVTDDAGLTSQDEVGITITGPVLSCIIELRQQGSTDPAETIEVHDPFVVYVGHSTGNIYGIRFSSDEKQDGNAHGAWSRWFNWASSEGDWNAESKGVAWEFATPGEKEVWVEVKDGSGNSVQCSAPAFAHPGYALVVAGQGGWREKSGIDHSANNAYRALRNLGFQDDHILYLNSARPQDVDTDGDDEVDETASLATFTDAIRGLADATYGSSTPVLIYLVGHGNPDCFVFDEDDSEDGFLWVGQAPGIRGLEELLSEFDDSVPCAVVIGSCYSGCFITTTETSRGSISAIGRAVVTSAHDDDPRSLWGWVRSSDTLWADLMKGADLRTAFESRTLPGDISHLWLDDNGDQVGHPPSNLADDGDFAERFEVGTPGSESLKLKSWLFYWLRSPGELRVRDANGRVTGLVDGQVREEIPDSLFDAEEDMVVLFAPPESYYCEVVGTAAGTYDLEGVLVDDGRDYSVAAEHMPALPGSVHRYTVDWDAIAEGEAGITLQVDAAGDGEFEETLQAGESLDGSVLEDSTPMQAGQAIESEAVEEDKGFPIWLIAVAGGVIALIVLLLALRSRRAR